MTDTELNTHEVDKELILERFRQQSAFSQALTINSLRLPVLLNGGALIALLTLLGNLTKNSSVILSEKLLVVACFSFIFGLISASAAHITELNQVWRDGRISDWKSPLTLQTVAAPATPQFIERHHVLKRATKMLLFASLVAFGIGAFTGALAPEAGRQQARARAVAEFMERLEREIQGAQNISREFSGSPR